MIWEKSLKRVRYLTHQITHLRITPWDVIKAKAKWLKEPTSLIPTRHRSLLLAWVINLLYHEENVLGELPNGPPATATFAYVPHSLLGPRAGISRNGAETRSLQAFFIRHFIACKRDEHHSCMKETQNVLAKWYKWQPIGDRDTNNPTEQNNTCRHKWEQGFPWAIQNKFLPAMEGEWSIYFLYPVCIIIIRNYTFIMRVVEM